MTMEGIEGVRIKNIEEKTNDVDAKVEDDIFLNLS